MKLDKYIIGKRYGKALFELAVKNEELDSVYQDLLKIREIYHEIPDLGEILSDVRLALYEKDELVEQLLQGFEVTVQNFLSVVYDYSRMNDLLLMIDEYERRYDEHKRLLLGTVVTAVPLTKDQHQLVEKRAADLLGYEKANLINLIEPKIIGGVIIEANNKVIDGSIHKKLEQIKTMLVN